MATAAVDGRSGLERGDEAIKVNNEIQEFSQGLDAFGSGRKEYNDSSDRYADGQAFPRCFEDALERC